MTELDALNRYFDAIKEADEQAAFFALFVDYLDHAATMPAFGSFLSSILGENDVWGRQYTDSKLNALDHAAARVLRLYDWICINENKPRSLVTSSPLKTLQGKHSIHVQLKNIREGGTGDRPELNVESVKTDLERLHNRFLSLYASKYAPVLGDAFLFYLSREKGLYRMFREQEESYPIHRARDRFSILNMLSKEFTPTQKIADTLRKKPQAIRAQMAGIRKEIEDHFIGIRGTDFIEGEQMRGYRIGDKITLKKKE